MWGLEFGLGRVLLSLRMAFFPSIMLFIFILLKKVYSPEYLSFVQPRGTGLSAICIADIYSIVKDLRVCYLLFYIAHWLQRTPFNQLKWCMKTVSLFLILRIDMLISLVQPFSTAVHRFFFTPTLGTG